MGVSNAADGDVGSDTVFEYHQEDDLVWAEYAGGSVRPGIGLPMCLISAEILLKNMRGDTSTGPVAEPAVGAGAGSDAGSGVVPGASGDA